MPLTKSTPESLSPLLHILQQQIVPCVREKGMDNVIVAAPSWKQFQQRDAVLPEGAYVERQPLKSRRVPVKARQLRRDSNSLATARWPEDALESITVPILCFVVAGMVALPLGDYAVHCVPGQMILQPAGTPHPDGSGRLSCLDESRMSNDYCSMLSLSPWAGGVQCWMNHTLKNQHITYRNPGEHCYVMHPLAYRYLKDFEKEAVERQPQYKLHCNGLLMALIALLVREIQLLQAFPFFETDLAPHSPIQDNDLISRAQTYIDDHLHESLSIDQVAAYVYMSRAYFTRQFRQATGKTFTEYVTECRLKKAKVLLRNTTWSLEMVGASVGISPEQLRRIFLRHEQQTPASFRRQSHS